MSFTFRDLFSEGDMKNSTYDTSRDLDSSIRESDSRYPQSMREENNGRIQHFLVSELLPFIPPAISAQSGIPMEKEVEVPLPANGSRDVELSTLYQVCPELFATEITCLNDSVVTLPAKLGLLADAPFSAPLKASEMSKPWVQASNGESSVKTPNPPESQEDNPSWSAPTSQTPKQVATAGKGFGSGFQSHSSPPIEKDESRKNENGTAADLVFSAPMNKKAEEGAETPQVSGRNGAEAPPTEFLNKPESDASFGFGGSSFGDSPNPFDSTEGFATLFSKQADGDAEIPFPESEVEPETEPESEKRDACEASGGFTWGIGQDPAQSSEEPAPLDSRFASSAGFPSPVVAERRELVTKTEVVKSDTEKESIELPVEPIEKTEEEPITPGSNSAATPASSGAKEFVSLSPSSLSNPVANYPPSINQASAEDEDELSRDLVFRAIFSVSEPFTLSKVARNVVGLEGISGCVLATPTKVVQVSKSEQSRVGDEAIEMVESIRNLARLSGVPEAKSFTLRADKGTVSLFLETDCCVTVHHEQEGFAPGVREKLILIAQSIHQLED